VNGYGTSASNRCGAEGRPSLPAGRKNKGLDTFFMTQNQDKMSVQELIERLPGRSTGIDCTGLTGASAAYLVSRLRAELEMPIFLVASSQKAVDSLAEDLHFFLPPSAVAASIFPAYNLSPFKFIAYHNETAARRIETLYRLVAVDAPPLVITSIEALLQKVIPRRELVNFAELIMAGEGMRTRSAGRKARCRWV
jgi:transcription-repair coupling factor (superfamily II helicase)